MLSTLKQILNSIALIPSVLTLCFVLIAVLQLGIDLPISEDSVLAGLVIIEKEDVQFILAFIIGGIFTLTIFSYTMVMNVLNRNISNYSPRLIPLLLSEKHHQCVLGFSSGTIIYAMILAIPIASSNTRSFPALGASIGVFFAIICVFLFIYFIHTVSQSIHINYILKEVFLRTEKNMLNQHQTHGDFHIGKENRSYENTYGLGQAGYLHQPEFDKLIAFCRKKKIELCLTQVPGLFINRKDVLFTYRGKLSNEVLDKLSGFFAVDHEVPLSVPETGFKHLVEVAVKAMSPAINDPGTAKSALDYFAQLLELRSAYPYYAHERLHISKEVSRILVTQQELLKYCFLELEQYLKDDPLLMDYLQDIKSRNDLAV